MQCNRIWLKLGLLGIVAVFGLKTHLVFGGDKDREIFAEYIVPTPPELVPYSRFLVKIVAPYHGPNTQEISYEFPPELTGEPGKVIRLTPDVSQNLVWKSPEMIAACTTLHEIFSCNVHLEKANIQSLSSRAPVAASGLDKQRALDFLKNQGLSTEEFNNRSAVLDHFHGGEPAGILTYEFDTY